MANRHPILAQGAEQLLDQLKTEIAERLNVQLGAEQTARANGSVGGEMTEHLCCNGATAIKWSQGPFASLLYINIWMKVWLFDWNFFCVGNIILLSLGRLIEILLEILHFQG